MALPRSAITIDEIARRVVDREINFDVETAKAPVANPPFRIVPDGMPDGMYDSASGDSEDVQHACEVICAQVTCSPEEALERLRDRANSLSRSIDATARLVLDHMISFSRNRR